MDTSSLFSESKNLFTGMVRLGRAVARAGLFALGVTMVIGLLIDTLYLGLSSVFSEAIDWEQLQFIHQAVLGTAPVNFCITLVAHYVATRAY